jgi:ATP citrate (pro-S)-lyase
VLVLLGEVGGIDEYEVVAALRSGRISKPLIAWCIGTCAKLFPYQVQFGHAGALAQGVLETAGASFFLRCVFVFVFVFVLCCCVAFRER